MSRFYGITLKPKSTYSEMVESSIHISSVAVESGFHSTKLYLIVNGQKFIVATLNNKKSQMSLNLNFGKGDHFIFKNSGHVDLSILGYMCPPTAIANDAEGRDGYGSPDNYLEVPEDEETNPSKRRRQY